MIIDEAQRDVLCELINIGIGHAASTLNALIQHKIRLTVPSIIIVHSEEEIDKLPEQLHADKVTSVSMGFNGDLDGHAALMFPTDSALILVSALTGEEANSPAYEDLRASTLAEVGNILLNGVMGSLSNMLGSNLSFTVPSFEEAGLAEIIHKETTGAIMVAQAQFIVDELLIEGNVLIFFEIASFDSLLKALEEMAA